jgi:hypothetical protein
MASYLDIDAHGRVVPQSDEVRRALADRAGRFALLPSAADLLVARRMPSAGGAAPRPRCILAGDLAAVPIGDFIAFLHQARVTGVLTVSAGGVERAVCFKDGEVRSAQSSAPGERVGEVAVRLGYLQDAQLAEALAGERPIGKTLVDRGLLSATDLWRCFHEQVTAVFHAILLLQGGVFALVDEDAADRQGTPLAVNTQALLMDGIRRIDELSLFRGKIPGPGTYLRRREPRRAVTLQPAEQSLLALVDGRRSVAQIATAARLSEFDATKLLYHLAEAGQVEAVAAPASAPVDPAARLASIAAGMNELFRLVTARVPTEGRPPFVAAVRGHLQDPAGRFAALWRMVLPGADGALDGGALLANLASLVKGSSATALEPTGDPARLLLEGLREVLFFYLFVAGERISREEDEALSAEVKRRLEALGGS